MADKKMSVLIILPDLRAGGAERVLTTITNVLFEKGYAVEFLLTKGSGIEYKLHSGIRLTINHENTSAIGQISFIRKKLIQSPQSIVVSFLTFQNLYTLLASIGLKNKVIVSERNDPSKTLYGRKYLGWLRNALYKRASAIVFQTEDAKKYFPSYIAKKGIIIGNPLRQDLPAYFQGKREKRLVAFSRLTKQKNLPMMIAAFEKFHREYPEYILEIYGKGEEEEAIKQLIIEKNLTESVFLKGFSRNVHEQILKATAFLSSSDYEGVSNSMLEAMAIGLPCICTDCPVGGAKTYIQTGINGILVPVGDTTTMVEAMAKLVHDEDLQVKLSKNAIKIRAQLSSDIVVEQWENLLQR